MPFGNECHTQLQRVHVGVPVEQPLSLFGHGIADDRRKAIGIEIGQGFALYDELPNALFTLGHDAALMGDPRYIVNPGCKVVDVTDVHWCSEKGASAFVVTRM